MAMILTDSEIIKYLEETRINPPKFLEGDCIFCKDNPDHRFIVRDILYRDGKFLYSGSANIAGKPFIFYPQDESFYEKCPESEDLERQERINFLDHCLFGEGMDESGMRTCSAGLTWVSKILEKFKGEDSWMLMRMALRDFSRLLDRRKESRGVNPLYKIKEEDMVLPSKEAEQLRSKSGSFKDSIDAINKERKAQAIQESKREGKLGYIQAKDDRALTDQEKEVLSHISSAFNVFVELDSKGIHDDEDFKNAANTMHRLIALRVARRVDPDVWS